MSAKSDASDQIKFLVCCIRNSNSGKTDFNAVATELGIVSKAAAQKRYERMLKANGVSNQAPSTPTAGDDGEGTPKKSSARKRGARAAGNTGEETPTKKGSRKALPKAMKNEETDDEETKSLQTPSKPGSNKAAKIEKYEDADDSPLSDAPPSETAAEAAAVAA